MWMMIFLTNIFEMCGGVTEIAFQTGKFPRDKPSLCFILFTYSPVFLDVEQFSSVAAPLRPQMSLVQDIYRCWRHVVAS